MASIWITGPAQNCPPKNIPAVGAKIVAAARKAGVKWFVVECEKRKNTYDDVAASAAYLKPLLGEAPSGEVASGRQGAVP